VDVTIKKKSGKIVKTFALRGAHNIDQVLLWIWRDLFVSMSASGGRRGRTKIPQMLVDIEDVLGWQALERLLYGGKDRELAGLPLSFNNLSILRVIGERCF